MEKLDKDFTRDKAVIDDGINEDSPLTWKNTYILMRIADKVDEIVGWLNKHEKK